MESYWVKEIRLSFVMVKCMAEVRYKENVEASLARFDKKKTETTRAEQKRAAQDGTVEDGKRGEGIKMGITKDKGGSGAESWEGILKQSELRLSTRRRIKRRHRRRSRRWRGC